MGVSLESVERVSTSRAVSPSLYELRSQLFSSR